MTHPEGSSLNIRFLDPQTKEAFQKECNLRQIPQHEMLERLVKLHQELMSRLGYAPYLDDFGLEPVRVAEPLKKREGE